MLQYVLARSACTSNGSVLVSRDGRLTDQASQTITRERYAESYRFEDPIVRYEGIGAFEINLRLLRTIFDINLDVHKVEVSGFADITSRYSNHC